MATLCRLEYLTRNGWVIGHHGMALLSPERYPERLAAHGKVGRVTILDDKLQPTGETFESPLCLDPEDLPQSFLDRLVPTSDGNPNHPRLMPEVEECTYCLGTLCDGDGSCLL